MSSPGSVTVPGPTDSQSFTVMVASEGGSCSLQSGQEQREVLPSGKTGHTADYIPMDMPPVIGLPQSHLTFHSPITFQ